MTRQEYTLSSYEPVYAFSPEIEIPQETIRGEMIANLRKHHCADGEEPKLTDEWISSHTDDFNTVHEFETVVKFHLYREVQKYQHYQDEDKLCAALAERLVEDIPQEVIDEAGFASRMRFDQYLRENVMTKQDYCKREGITEDELDQRLLDQAIQGYREDMALGAWVRHFGLKLDSDDIYAVIPGDSIEEKLETRRKIEANGGLAGLEEYALKVKAMNQVVETGFVKRTEHGEYLEVSAPSIELSEAFRNNPDMYVRL